jgi:vancomycin resistance protein VanJ
MACTDSPSSILLPTFGDAPPMVIECGCGEVYQADDHDVGGWLRCRCGRIVHVRRSEGRQSERAAMISRPRGRWSWQRSGTGKHPGVSVGTTHASAVDRGGTRAAVTRWLVRLSWAYLAVAAIAWAALWTLSDRWWPATLYLFGARWILLFPLAALIPAALKLRASLLVPLAAAAAIALLPVMGLRFGWRSRLLANDAATVLRVVTLNTDGALGPALDLPVRLEEWRADIVALQECGDALRDAVRQVPGRHSHVAEQLCLLSRHPIRDARVTRWDDLAAARETGIGGSSKAVGYVIETPQRSISFVNLHLETARKGLEGVFELDVRRVSENTMLHAVESGRTRAWLGRVGGSVIIVGDFNMPVESAIHRRDWSEFRNAFSQAGIGFGMTRDNGWIQVRIDHILTGSQWRPRRVVVGPVVGLDHRPVIADLGWAGPRAPSANGTIRVLTKGSADECAPYDS